MLPFHTCYSAYSLSRKTRGKVFIVLALSNQSLMMFFFFGLELRVLIEFEGKVARLLMLK